MKESEAWPFAKKLPSPVKKFLWSSLTLTGVAGTTVAGAFASSKDGTSKFTESDDQNVNQPKVERQIESAQVPEDEKLDLPFPPNPQMNVQQAWKAEDGSEHKGVDYIKGTIDRSATWQQFPVLAAEGGAACSIPQERQSNPAFGNAVVIVHPNRFETYYGHLRETPPNIPNCTGPNRGTTDVRQGQEIGMAGSTGLSNPRQVHLHFQVRNPQGQVIDPYDLYEKRAEYPDPNFTNGKVCGDEHLWSYCPTEISSQPKATPTKEFTEQEFYSSPEEAIGVYLDNEQILFDETCSPGKTCAYWYLTQNNFRLYYVWEIPVSEEFRFSKNSQFLMLENSQRGWRVLSTDPFAYSSPFYVSIEASYTGYQPPTAPEPRTVLFQMYSSDILFNNTIIIRTCIKNNTQNTIPWKKDSPGQTFIEDNRGRRYFSLNVGGRYTQDFPGLPPGKGWCGWHQFATPENFNTLTLHYPGQEPTAIFLSQKN